VGAEVRWAIPSNQGAVLTRPESRILGGLTPAAALPQSAVGSSRLRLRSMAVGSKVQLAIGSSRIRLRSLITGIPGIPVTSFAGQQQGDKVVWEPKILGSRLFRPPVVEAQSAAGSSRIRLRSSATGVSGISVMAFGGQRQGDQVAPELKQLGSRLYQPAVAAGPQSAPASGRIKLRSQALGRAQIAALGRIRLRSRAFGSPPPQSAVGSGRIRIRSSVVGKVLALGVGRLRLRSRTLARAQIPAQSRVRLRSRAFGAAGVVPAPPATGRIRLRSRAVGVLIPTAPAHGHIRLRSRALARVLGAGHGRIRLRSQAIPRATKSGQAQGRIRLYSRAVSTVLNPGLPVADPEGVLTATQGEAVLVGESGHGILTPVSG
jgi:hypothetical protein